MIVLQKNRVNDDSSPQQKFGQYLKEARQQRGWSAIYLAECLGHGSDSEIMAWEGGNVAVPLSEIFALANALELAPDELISAINRIYLGR